MNIACNKQPIRDVAGTLSATYPTTSVDVACASPKGGRATTYNVQGVHVMKNSTDNVNTGNVNRRPNPPLTTCNRCGSEDYHDTPIHGGRSTRRDCAKCRRFMGWPRWYDHSMTGLEEVQPRPPPSP